MLTRLLSIATGVSALGAVLFTVPSTAQAVTVWDLSGAFVGHLTAQFAGGNSDYFHTVIGQGSTFTVDAHNNGIMTLNASGILKDTTASNSETVGSINFSLSYFWGSLDHVALLSNGQTKDYILSLTPDGQGNGAGLISNVSINSNGLSDSETFNLAAKSFHGHDAYAPVSGYLQANNVGTYLILGNLPGVTGPADAIDFKTWLMSSIFNLALGAGRTGAYQITASDIHGIATLRGPGTEVPEPASMALLGMGLLGGVFARKRKAQAV